MEFDKVKKSNSNDSYDSLTKKQNVATLCDMEKCQFGNALERMVHFGAVIKHTPLVKM
jgi:hypothetical protein